MRAFLFVATGIVVAFAASCEDSSDTAATSVASTTTAGSGGSGAATSSTVSTSASTGVGGTGGGEPVAFTFFVTSVGSGALGGNLGGLAGADAICQGLADSAGAGNATWHAYLSTTTENARDRIGTGPWSNFNGDIIAMDVAALHTDGLSNGMPQHAIDETGNTVPSAEHDILTGSMDDGTLFANANCQDWTSDSPDDVARVGHSDIPSNPNFSPSWNSAHNSAGCDEAGLIQFGGAGRLYCFAL